MNPSNYNSYLYYRKNKLIVEEKIGQNKVTLELKDGRTVILHTDEIMKRKIVLAR